MKNTPIRITKAQFPTVCVNAELHLELQKFCDKFGLKMKWVCEQAVERFMTDYEKRFGCN